LNRDPIFVTHKLVSDKWWIAHGNIEEFRTADRPWDGTADYHLTLEWSISDCGAALGGF